MNDHEANGLIENANHTLRSFYHRLRSCDKRSTGEVATAEAAYVKTYLLRQKSFLQSSSFIEDVHLVLRAWTYASPPPMSVEEHGQNVSRRFVDKMLRTPVYKQKEIKIGDGATTWKDGSGWLGPVRVTKVRPYY